MKPLLPVLFVLSLLLSILIIPTAARPSDISIYSDALSSGWQNWSWGATIDLASTAPVHIGSGAIRVAYTSGWGGLSLRASTPVAASDLESLDFWALGATGGTRIDLYLQTTDSGSAGPAKTLDIPVGVWTHFTVPLSELGNPTAIARINWQENQGGAQAAYSLDDIKLVGLETPPVALSLSVNASADRHPIPDAIYGINMHNVPGIAAYMQELGIPLRRWGGNAVTRYNYQNDISNHASDWYFGNVKESDAEDLPDDSAVNRFIRANRAAEVQSLIVTPMSGYVANDNPLACGFSIQKYGAQTGSAAGDYRPDCGNGVYPGGALITGNDPLDTSIAIGPDFVQGWVNDLRNCFGAASAGGVRYYNLDNEPDLWWETHRDVAPVGLTYDGFRDRAYAYGAAIKAGDPGALVLGPTLGVWSYYFYSAYDLQREDYATPDDRLAHGDVPFVDWYLGQMQTYQQQHSVRILDYLDLHYYPQSGVALVAAGDADRQALRLRSTRSLWDPTYVDESWIQQAGPDGGIVRLIPRMRQWVAENYPGTRLAIGEYNWGGMEHINGALAQADVLGIFGRERLDLATLWDPPDADQPGAFAFRMFRNYDGLGKCFGDIGILASSTDQGRLAVYAAQRTSDQALTVIVINKTGEALTAPLALSGATPSTQAQVYRYSPANLSAIQVLPSQAVSASGFIATYPAQSITLFEIRPAATTIKNRLYLPVSLK